MSMIDHIRNVLPQLKFNYPGDKSWRISQPYGAKNTWDKWHIDTEGMWQPGQINGFGCHKGIDFAIPEGTPIQAICEGSCFKSDLQNPNDIKDGFGMRIWQQFTFDNLTFSIFYAHLSLVQILPGNKISAKQEIALSGNTGHSTGAHLHLELRDPLGQSHPIIFID